MCKANLGFHSTLLKKHLSDSNVSDNDARQVPESMERANTKLSSDRVIVENFFGRLKTPRGLASDKYMWKKDDKIKTKNPSSEAKYRENRKARIQAVLGRANTGYTSEDYDIGYEEGDDIFE
ncbi:hypothetical protein H257_05349 [Aphanomyces astaci]|uniref:DDE Tnp4 domain-containing protein n=1 Tax=Aphanomyces astaci TaxID=112090 RepID=W4GPX6_APHAT|nr:hypothetical protein H257_05349 [Aphanomyces astaci]ETV81757.1 hypothetical protein H257_05349 [Aphanomyces astaci]|eukprot:XP_009828494.1 hypothetical protein H257_05349 [Aphanomyces astaci]